MREQCEIYANDRQTERKTTLGYGSISVLTSYGVTALAKAIQWGNRLRLRASDSLQIQREQQAKSTIYSLINILFLNSIYKLPFGIVSLGKNQVSNR